MYDAVGVLKSRTFGDQQRGVEARRKKKRMKVSFSPVQAGLYPEHARHAGRVCGDIHSFSSWVGDGCVLAGAVGISPEITVERMDTGVDNYE